jgi:ribosomal protein L14E/L6E/L27E
MEFERAQIVRSRKGHDAGNLLCVMDVQDRYLLLADGKDRRAESPKRKNVKHVELLGTMKHPTIEKVRTGQPVRNKELRQVLAVFRDEMEV